MAEPDQPGRARWFGRRNLDNYRGQRRENTMGVNDMKRLAEHSSDIDILMRIVDRASGFDKELDEDHHDAEHHEHMLLKLELIAKSCRCESAPGTRLQLLMMVNSSKLMTDNHLPRFITNILDIRNDIIGQPASVYSKALINMLTIIKYFHLTFPHAECLKKASDVLNMVQFAIETGSGVADCDVQTAYMEVESLKNDLRKEHNVEIPQRSFTNEKREDRLEPPNDYRQLNVIPSLEDIYPQEESFLRANKCHGKYQDLDHYLDVQFRLLREDFVHPLRCGIQTYLDRKNGRLPHDIKLNDIKIYENVSRVGPVCRPNHQGLAYRLKLDMSKLKHIKWEYSKRLIYGTLLSLSSDDFLTMFCCTVVNRDQEDLKQGYIDVYIEQNEEGFASIGSEVKFTMAETTAYFEACRHVLHGLQEITPQTDLPFQRYIVRCETVSQSPYYLCQEEVKFDFSPIISGIISDTDTDNPACEDQNAMQAVRNVAVLDTSQWPSAEDLKLDPSQHNALQLCLTSEFALVQGPPGTGKTFLGLKLVQVLLHNWSKWNNNLAGHRPMLIVCYTNHALDQFLEGIQQFYDKNIVRVGTRSQSESLKKHNLNDIRNDMRQQGRVPHGLYQAYKSLRQDMDTLQSDIHKTTIILGTVDDNILLLDKLADVMLKDHYEDLKDSQNSIADFLDLGNQLNPLADGEEFADAIEIREQPEMNLEPVDTEAVAIDDVIAMPELLNDGNNEITKDTEKHKEKWKNLMKDVQESYYDRAEDFNRRDQWQKQGRNSKKNLIKQALSYIKHNVQAMTQEEVENIGDLRDLSMAERHRLYRYWTIALKESLERKNCAKRKEYQDLALRLKEVKDQIDKEIMINAKIIGMTTTAAARYHAVLQEIQPKVIIVEEAAEVLEAHIVTTLSRNCEHLVLIGDHKQLRPSATVYELAKKYNFDLSLFERMVNNGMPIAKLVLQHRMRPQIAELMSPIYENLENDENVKYYDSIGGVAGDMYIICHTHPEEHNEEHSSKENSFEASYVTKLCKYLLLQDYKPSQITVLTTYKGQFFRLKQLMPKKEFGVRIDVVDNFQGEESDIILLSLVRSNAEGKIGFLSVDNRVCVALSRAKMGFFVVGDIDFLARHSKLWQQVKEIALSQQILGPALPILCQKHPDTKIMAALPSDFDKAPEGGCQKPCAARLECGHACPRACHSYDPNHEKIKCTKMCTKTLCDKNHRCPKKCSENCGPCMVLVTKKMPQCNHVVMLACYKEPALWQCQYKCERKLPCGHKCDTVCGKACTTKCTEIVSRNLPCGHQQNIQCHEDPASVICRKKCSSNLVSCQHECPGTCGECQQGRLHESCTETCDRILVCGHECKEPCSESCPPCKRKCENRCQHSKCQKTCGEQCVPCKEPCLWSCKHYQCNKLCSEPCDRPRCDEPCDKFLDCGHPCIGLCGELCPKLCRICHADMVTEIFLGSEDEPGARFVALEDCGHLIEVTGLDQYMITTNQNAIALKCCPKCKTPIRRNLRYSHDTKTTLADIEKVKIIAYGDPDTRLAMKITTDDKLEELEEKDKTLAEHILNLILKRNSMTTKKATGLSDDSLMDKYKEATRRHPLALSELICIENMLNFALHLNVLRKGLGIVRDLLANLGIELAYTLKQYEMLRSWFTGRVRISVSKQECTEYKQELLRMTILLKLCRQKNHIRFISQTCSQEQEAKAKAAAAVIDNALKVLLKGKPFSKEVQDRLKEIIKEINKQFPMTGLGISQEEKTQVLQAMGLNQGHWFKCPNGHIYVITECGGAMEESRCSECGAAIGGTSHTLRQDNSLATEMDGATAAAWPTALQR